MLDLAKPRLNEIWGQGPFFPERCWLAEWPLSSSEISTINLFLLSQVLELT